jgi:hypothetical protein
VQKLCQEAWLDIGRVNDGEIEWRMRYDLSKQVVNLMEQWVQADKSSSLMRSFVTWASGWFQLLLCSSTTAVPPDSALLHQLMKLFELMKR